jgi:hypothetical protein
LRRRAWISSIAVIVVSVSLLFSLYVHSSPSPSQGDSTPSDSSASDDELIGPIGQYLTKPPYFPNYTDEITKIFLVDARLKLNESSNRSFMSDSGYDNFEGVPAVVVTATVRNDYSVSEVIQFMGEGISRIDIWLDVYLYDKEGDIVDTLQQGNPFKGSVQLLLNSGEVSSVNLVLALSNSWNSDDIDYFEIYVSYPFDIPVS